jgi:hypothetical protein
MDHQRHDTNTAKVGQSTVIRYHSRRLFGYLYPPRAPIVLPKVPAPDVDNPFFVDPDWLLQLGRPQ